MGWSKRDQIKRRVNQAQGNFTSGMEKLNEVRETYEQSGNVLHEKAIQLVMQLIDQATVELDSIAKKL